jgi:hypothetical protein
MLLARKEKVRKKRGGGGAEHLLAAVDVLDGHELAGGAGAHEARDAEVAGPDVPDVLVPVPVVHYRHLHRQRPRPLHLARFPPPAATEIHGSLCRPPAFLPQLPVRLIASSRVLRFFNLFISLSFHPLIGRSIYPVRKMMQEHHPLAPPTLRSLSPAPPIHTESTGPTKMDPTAIYCA